MIQNLELVELFTILVLTAHCLQICMISKYKLHIVILTFLITTFLPDDLKRYFSLFHFIFVSLWYDYSVCEGQS